MDKKYKAQAISLLFFPSLVLSFQELDWAGPGSYRQRVTHTRPQLLSLLSGRRWRAQPQGQPMKLTVRWEIVPWMDIIEHDFFFFSKGAIMYFFIIVLCLESNPSCVKRQR